mmetsp:Transcript_23899/g.40656  ORF Transcript_23899/g.40656 Transcript_23899/m.40656 type:complete len:470 (+) Transcript_23899:129-1538(+)
MNANENGMFPVMIEINDLIRKLGGNLCLLSVLVTFISLCVTTTVYIILWKQFSQLEKVLEFWSQALNFWITYIAFNLSFPQCHKLLDSTSVTACYILMELIGRGLVLYVKKKQKEINRNCTQEKVNLELTKVSLKLILVFYLSIISLFLRLGGLNVCTCLYITTSFTAIFDVLTLLFNCNLQHCTEQLVKAMLLRRAKRINPDFTSSGDTYSSETLPDLQVEMATLLRTNVQNLINILRLCFTLGSQIYALQTFGIQFHMFLYCFNTVLRVGFHVITFMFGLSETWDVRGSYMHLTDNELKPYLLSRSDHVKNVESAVYAPVQPTEGSSIDHEGDSARYHTSDPNMSSLNKSINTKAVIIEEECATSDDREGCSAEVGHGSSVQDDITAEGGEPAHNTEIDICAICLSAQNVETVKLKVCQHRYHEGCLLCLLRLAGGRTRAKKCPLCRAQISAGGGFDEDTSFPIPLM